MYVSTQHYEFLLISKPIHKIKIILGQNSFRYIGQFRATYTVDELEIRFI